MFYSCKPSGHVGFGSLPDQVYRRAVRKGFEFSLMVVGESGLGKVNSIEKYHRADMKSSLGMSIFFRENNISACKMWFIQYKCTNCSTNSKYKCTLHPNIMADPRLTY